MINNTVNYYELLEISPDATLQEIHQGYKKAKATYSTSNAAIYSIFNEEEANELNKLIEEAYNVLSHPDQKRKYDQRLNQNHENINDEDDEPEIYFGDESPVEIESPEEVVVKDGQIIKNFEPDNDFEEKIKSLDDCSGYFLRKVRQYKNISIEEVAQFSKISKTNILALENEDLEALPARVFIRGFVLQVARLLGLNSNKYAQGYMKIIDEKK